MFFLCHFYDLRLRLWIWEVESCKKLIVTLCWWSDHCHCVVILFFFYKTGLWTGPARQATRTGTARSQPVGPCLGLRPGTRAAEARHGRYAGQIDTARYSSCPTRDWPEPVAVYKSYRYRFSLHLFFLSFFPFGRFVCLFRPCLLPKSEKFSVL